MLCLRVKLDSDSLAKSPGGLFHTLCPKLIFFPARVLLGTKHSRGVFQVAYGRYLYMTRGLSSTGAWECSFCSYSKPRRDLFFLPVTGFFLIILYNSITSKVQSEASKSKKKQERIQKIWKKIWLKEQVSNYWLFYESRWPFKGERWDLCQLWQKQPKVFFLLSKYQKSSLRIRMFHLVKVVSLAAKGTKRPSEEIFMKTT